MKKIIRILFLFLIMMSFSTTEMDAQRRHRSHRTSVSRRVKKRKAKKRSRSRRSADLAAKYPCIFCGDRNHNGYNCTSANAQIRYLDSHGY